MRTYLTLPLLAAGLILAGPASAQTIHYPPAMQRCARAMNAAIHRIQRLRRDPTLDATPATRAARTKVEELVVRDTHLLAAIFGRLQHDSAFRRGPAGTRDVCLLARAYEADAHVLSLAIRAGQSAGRRAPARSGGGAAAGVAGLLPQSDRATGGPGPIQYTHTTTSRTRSDTYQRSERAQRSRTRSRQYSTTRTRSRQHSQTSSTRAGASQTVGATRVIDTTETISLACPTWGGPTTMRGMEAAGMCGEDVGQVDCQQLFHQPISAPTAAAARRIVAQGQRAARSARAANAASPLSRRPRP